MKILVTKRAKRNFQRIKNDIEEKWGAAVAVAFQQKTQDFLELLEDLDFEFFDQQIKIYANVGIINGRIKAFADEAYVAEVFYTAVFVKKNDKWMYENWHGSWTKDTPPPPPFISEN
jgi:hypothetical protein